jgi:chromatin remodeling complex protein RSC6
MAALAKEYGCGVAELASRKKAVRSFIEEFLAEKEGDDDDEEEEEEELPAEKKKGKRKAGKRRRADDSDEEEAEAAWKPVVLSGLSKAVVLSQPLADLLGVKVLGRSGIQRAIIEYVKKHELQDEKDKRNITADDALKDVFQVNKFTFFGLSKLISGHVEKAEDCGDEELMKAARDEDVATLARLKREREEKIANGEKPPVSAAAKRRKKEKTGGRKSTRGAGAGATGERSTTGLNAPMTLSDELSAVCGGERVLSRPQVVKALWTYIKEHDLKDPSNGRNIICDDKLSGLFDGVKEVNGFGMNKYLSQHLTKIPK